MPRNPKQDKSDVDQVIALKKQNLESLRKEFSELSAIYSELYPVAMMLWSKQASVAQAGKEELYSKLNKILQKLQIYDKKSLAWMLNEKTYRNVLPDEVLVLIDAQENNISEITALIEDINDRVNSYKDIAEDIRKLVDRLDNLLSLMKKQVFKA